jgi:hypothetical protein
MSGTARIFPNQPKSAKSTLATTTAKAPIFPEPRQTESPKPASTSQPQTSFKIPKPPSVPQFQMPSLANSGRGKLITTLAIISLVLGVIIEIITVGTGYHNMNKAEYEARIKAMETLAAECSPLASTSPECDRRYDRLLGR